MTEKKKGAANLQKVIKKGLNALRQLPELYQKSSTDVNVRWLGSIFPENLVISEIKRRTARVNEAMLLIAATGKWLSQNKNGQPFQNLELSADVESTGVEPSLLSSFKLLAKLHGANHKRI